MFAHGDNDIREPVYDLASPLTVAVEMTNAGTGTGMEKTAVENEQTYHLDPMWNGNFLLPVHLY